jgi:hypothetical protein
MDRRPPADVAYSLDRHEVSPTFHFMLKCLLYSRLQTGLVSNRDFYDEDVNVYMAHLLQGFINPAYIERLKPYLSQYDSEVFSRLSCSTDARLKYTIYKSNADFLLVSMGIFDDATAIVAERRRGRKDNWTLPSEEAYAGRGKTYYRFAYTYSQQLSRKRTALGDVLEKLSIGFDRYIKILSHMRGEYFDLMRRLSTGEVFHLERSVDEEARKDDLTQKQNKLLDLFAEWQRTKSHEIWDQIQAVVEEIQHLDPNFRFSVPEA